MQTLSCCFVFGKAPQHVPFARYWLSYTVYIVIITIYYVEGSHEQQLRRKTAQPGHTANARSRYRILFHVMVWERWHKTVMTLYCYFMKSSKLP